MVENQLRRAVRIADNFVVPQPDDHPPLIFEKLCPLPVVIGRLFGMLSAVELHRHAGFPAGQIDDVRPDYELPRESRTILAQAQPQQAFRLGRIVPQVAGISGEPGVDAAHVRFLARLAGARTHPLPLPGREGRKEAANLRECSQ
jgi:hypothetical protein